MKNFIYLSVLMVGMLGSIEQAAAYSHQHCLGENVKWSGTSKTLRADPTSFPTGSWRNALQESIDRFNENPANFSYGLATDSGGVKLGNGSSEIWGSTSASVLQVAPAIAYSYKTCYWFFGDVVHMDEVDVIFDYGNPWTWTTSNTKSNLLRYGGSLRPIQTTALHEISHGVKLSHVNTEYNIMGTDFEHIHVNSNTARAYLGEDAADGMVHLYGTDSDSRQDVAVVHWKYDGASGEYSNHRKVQLRNSAGSVINSTTSVNGETHYRVNAGQTVRVEFTYENNGASYQGAVATGFYVSTNSNITTWDDRIGGTTLTLGRANVYTAQHTVTLPGNLNSGTNYWVGVIVDETGSIGEVAEWNNTTYIPIRIN